MKALIKDKGKRYGKPIFRISLLIITSLLLILISNIGKRIYIEELSEGDISLRPIYSPFDFSYQGDIDELKTKEFQAEAIQNVPDVYIFIPIPLSLEPESLPEELKELPQESKDFVPKINEIYNEISAKIILSIEDELNLAKEKTDKITVKDKAKATERLVLLDDLLKQRNLPKILEPEAAKKFESRKIRNLAVDLLEKKIQPNLIFDKDSTELNRKEAASRVPLQYKQIEVKKGESIVNKGDRITKTHVVKIGKIKEISKELAKKERIISSIGIGVIIIIIIVIFIVFLKTFEKEFFLMNRNLVLVSLLSVLAVGISNLVAFSSWPSLVIPAANFSMAIMLLLNNHEAALLFVIFLSLFLRLGLSFSVNIMIVFILSGVVGIISVRGVRRRTQIILAGLIIGIVNFFTIIGLGLFNNLNYAVFLNEALLGMFNGIICAFFLMGILPILEWIFGYITNISLLELSDFNQPILRELILKAPGTYHHSLIVGNISEAAAEVIGANSLLARVGAYYHDIGKIEKSEYFSENQTEEQSIHDTLSPSMSKLIIVNHVKNGIDLVQKFRLKKAIRDFIEQHHGTSLVYYFYRRALEELEEDQEVKEEGFRYPGPKPQTKETAIVLLADSVEAATRGIQDSSPQKIENVVQKIINNKFIDGQLDECDLTLKDLEKIAGTFIHILSATYHSRVKYPEQKDESKNIESPKEDSHKPQNHKRPDSGYTPRRE